VSIEMTVPDAVGRDLQYAQDTMQAAGFFSLTSHDATGQDRFQVVDRNWTVCDQSPPGGTTADPATRIDFGAVKEDETCPGP
jgi:beta-lactam-binding protein with PASTA domain